MAYRDFAKDAAVLMVVWGISSLVSFLVLPVITKTLGPYYYGVWTQVYVTVTLLTAVVILGQDMTLLRFFSTPKEKEKTSKEFFTVLFFVGILGFAIAAILALAANVVAGLLFSDDNLTAFVVLSSLLVPFTALNMMTTFYFRAVGSIRAYSGLILFNSVGMLILILVLLIYTDLGITGVVVGNLFTNLTCFIVAIIVIISRIGFSKPQWNLLGPKLKFGLPLTPNSILRWITNSSDRYLVAIILGLTLTGIYSAAYSIGAITFLVVVPLQIVLYPTLSRLYDLGELEEVKSYLSRSLRYFLMFTIPSVAGISVMAKPLIFTLTSPEFMSGAVVIPFVALAGLFSGAFKFVENITHLVKKTHLNLITFVVPAITDVVLVLLLTPIMGIAGAALATTISFALMLVIGYFISSKFIRFPIDWRFAAKSTASSFLMVVVIALINPTDLGHMIICTVIGGGVYFVTLIALKGVTQEEIGLARGLVNQFMSKILKPKTSRP